MVIWPYIDALGLCHTPGPKWSVIENHAKIHSSSFELICQSNAANSSWNFILNQMISQESVLDEYPYSLLIWTTMVIIPMNTIINPYVFVFYKLCRICIRNMKKSIESSDWSRATIRNDLSTSWFYVSIVYEILLWSDSMQDSYRWWPCPSLIWVQQSEN